MSMSENLIHFLKLFVLFQNNFSCRNFSMALMELDTMSRMVSQMSLRLRSSSKIVAQFSTNTRMLVRTESWVSLPHAALMLYITNHGPVSLSVCLCMEV